MTDTTTNEEAASSDHATQVRNQVVDDLIADGTILSAPVEAAMRKVPRELFAPGVNLEEVYHRSNGVVTKRDEDGNSISSVSALQVQAHMLEQAEITVGMRILEIGSGGYNAALLAELVGPSGQVTTVDIDEDITDRASRLLGETGYLRVNVVLADAEGGVPEYAPYDRILVTAGAWDIPPAWVAQLAEGGRLLVPWQVRGLSRTIAFEQADGCLVSRSSPRSLSLGARSTRRSTSAPPPGSHIFPESDTGEPLFPRHGGCLPSVTYPAAAPRRPTGRPGWTHGGPGGAFPSASPWSTTTGGNRWISATGFTGSCCVPAWSAPAASSCAKPRPRKISPGWAAPTKCSYP